jgi:hypothetical protein
VQLPVDTSNPIEISPSLWQTAKVALIGAGFVAAGYFMSGATEGTGRYSAETLHWVGYFSMAFFGLGTAVSIWRVFRQRGPWITLSPQGIHDIRVSEDVIPWTAIASLSTWTYARQSIMIVGLKPGVEQALKLTRAARLSRGPNKSLGADGLAIPTQGTDFDHERLISTTQAFLARYGN